MRNENQKCSLSRFKEFLSVYIETLAKIILPLKVVRLAEMHLADQLDNYKMEDDVLDLSVKLSNEHTAHIKLFYEKTTEDGISDESLLSLFNIESEMQRIMTLLQMYSRVKRDDHSKNDYVESEFYSPEATYEFIDQIVDSIGYETLSDAVEEFKDLLKMKNVEVEKLELIESNN